MCVLMTRQYKCGKIIFYPWRNAMNDSQLTYFLTLRSASISSLGTENWKHDRLGAITGIGLTLFLVKFSATLDLNLRIVKHLFNGT